MTQKFLVIKIGAIGDSVMTLPTLKKMREDHPKAHITWMGGCLIQDLVESFSMIDSYICIDEKKLFSPSHTKKLHALFQAWRNVFFKRFDAVYIFHSDKRYRLLSWFCFAKIKRLCTSPKYIKLDQYHALSYLKLYENPAYPNQIQIKYPKMAFVDSKWKNHRLNFIKPSTIAICPGGAKNPFREQTLKRWPIQHYQKLAKKFILEGCGVLLVGASSDRWVLPYFEELPVSSIIGETTLLEMCYALHLSSFFITHDTGPMHLAKLTNTPSLALFGPTSEKTFLSSNENIIAMRSEMNLSCRPCYDGKNFAPCKNNLCMFTLKPEDVFEKAKKILQTSPAVFKQTVPHHQHIE